ncbi:hypothetical protein [Rossellomorea marisflavi]|uniref:hypothetical protein n=1 Tax=Rossellomorea marisflavi TaxID=189381 RepID=UPI0011E81135|nr:hypothetical protein [Rossellomorea marisflavi]TYO73050.1 hypothetical protein DQ398_001967 [Rossellomorea marisflavi]
MDKIEVFMLKNGEDKGLAYTGGYIYSVEKHVAESFEKEGIAKEIRYQSLSSHQENVSTTIDEMKKKIESIEADDRLTPDAKFFDIQAVIQQYEGKVNEIQDKYSRDLQILQDAAARKASEIALEDDFNPDKVRQKAGIIRAEVEMSLSLIEAAELLQNELRIIDKGTARELLSQFTDIKKSLEEKGESAHISDRLIRRAVRNVYNDLKKASEDSNQVAASAEYRMLSAIKEHRGDITGPLKAFKRRKR